jgi:thiol-disulfide isomerase/thioredoxin
MLLAMMKNIWFLVVCLASTVLAENFKTVDGKEYNNVTVSRVEPDGIVVVTSIGISKIYFAELPKDIQQRFHYNTGKAAAYAATEASAQAGPVKQRIEVISHGNAVDINQHLALGNVTLVDFYADWCGPCRRISPSVEQLAKSDPDLVLRKVDIGNWNTPVARQYHVESIPRIEVYNRSGQLVGTVQGAKFEDVKRYVAQAKAG